MVLPTGSQWEGHKRSTPTNRGGARAIFARPQLLDHYLTILTFLPLAGAFVIAFLPRGSASAVRRTALIFSLGAFVLAVGLFSRFSGETGIQFVEDHPWISSPPIHYHL